MKSVAPDQISRPRFYWRYGKGEAFALSSHALVREALDIGLAIKEPGFNIFVVGDDRAGRLSATIEYLRDITSKRKEDQYDWVYLFNFKDHRAPLAFSLDPGDGEVFADNLRSFVRRLQTMLTAALESESHRERVLSCYRSVEEKLHQQHEEIRIAARYSGYDLEQTNSGIRLKKLKDEQSGGGEDYNSLVGRLDKLENVAGRLKMEAEEAIEKLDRQTLSALLTFHKEILIASFSRYTLLTAWIEEMITDMLNHLDLLYSRTDKERAKNIPIRYQANVLVDRSAPGNDNVIIEPNPTYDNLFGRIEYARINGVVETNLTLIRPGSLHFANGGVLVLRAEALAKNETTWTFLKAALRDREIRIEELHRSGAMPITGTPSPQPIPLEVKIVIIGSPDQYYRYFSNDPDFRSYFKIKADIDPDMPATQSNIDNMAELIRQMTVARSLQCEDSAVGFLLGISSRYAQRRDMLSARFELIQDLIDEACLGCRDKILTLKSVENAWVQKRRRDSHQKERFLENIKRGHIAITTQGEAVGQINGLTVRDSGDQHFGRPSRITARAWVGEKGIINIERIADLGGPIHQKGTLIVEGYLRGIFGGQFPISFDCSITFEQNYSGVEGDSASVAELVVIISALSGLPIRQDFAVTGSFNQLGEAQAVGDVIDKVEGFFHATKENRLAKLNSGVVLPSSNIGDLVLEDEIVQAIEEGSFSVIGIDKADEAVEFFIGAGTLSCQDIYYQALARLAQFDEILAKRRSSKK